MSASSGWRSGDGALWLSTGAVTLTLLLTVTLLVLLARVGFGHFWPEPLPTLTFDSSNFSTIQTVTLTAVTDGGLEVTVGGGLPGFIRRADLSRDRAEQRADRFAVGEKVDAVITNIDRKTRKLTLSIKARETAEEKQAVEEYGSSDSGASLGDILGAALAKRESGDEE